jgi:hypothetical protein
MPRNYQLKLKPIAQLALLDQDSLSKELTKAMVESIPEWDKENRARAKDRVDKIIARIQERIHSNKLQKAYAKKDKRKEKNLELKGRME